MTPEEVSFDLLITKLAQRVILFSIDANLVLLTVVVTVTFPVTPSELIVRERLSSLKANCGSLNVILFPLLSFVAR